MTENEKILAEKLRKIANRLMCEKLKNQRNLKSLARDDAMSKIKIIGMDFSGLRMINEFIRYSNLDFDSIAINTSKSDLDFSNAKIKIRVGKNELFGLDGGSPQRSERMVRECHDENFSTLNGAEIIICVSDFVSDDGEGMPPVIADIAKEIGAVAIFFAIIPPAEGVVPFRRKNIEEYLKKLTEKTEYVIQIDFWYFTKFISSKIRVVTFLEMCERLTIIDIDYFLKNYLKWTEKICELQRGTSKD